MLNGFDRDRQQILDQPDFFLQEWFGVGHAAEHAVEARHGVDAGTNFVVSGEEVLARFLVAELRFVGKDRSKLSLKLIADVDYK